MFLGSALALSSTQSGTGRKDINITFFTAEKKKERRSIRGGQIRYNIQNLKRVT
jgi:hypothetical protein